MDAFLPEERADARFVDVAQLRTLVGQLFEREGLAAEDAATAADILVDADLGGVWSHGVARVPMYLERLRRGVARARPDIKVQSVAAAAALVDGDDGLGLVVAPRAMQEALAIAKRSGVGLVGVRRSGHFGAGAWYLRQATAAGCIALSFTTASPAIAPWGGAQPLFGTSPLGFAAPTSANRAFVIDMAMSRVARGKLKFAAQRGEEIPSGYAVTAQGTETTDGNAAFDGMMVPFGEHKGAALSWMMDVFAGVFTGAAFGGDAGNPFKELSRPQDIGHVFIAMRCDLFVPADAFAARMNELDRRAKAVPTAPGFDRIEAPGEPELRRRLANLRRGVPLTPDVLDTLREQASRAGVAFPF